ncbi:fimbrial protein [Ewingella allii]|uniref:fimbrial protein n=1 Tax=Ewingella allii TaxID=3092550 RepID=UPI0037BDC90A
MKKLSIAVAMMLGMACSVAQARDYLGQIMFSGKVSSASCSIDGAGTTSTINFTTYAKNIVTYGGGNSVANMRPMTIKLVSCPAGLPIKVKFEGAYDETSKGFKESSGKNIAAIIRDEGSQDRLEGNKFVTKTTSVSGVNELKYNVNLLRWKNADLETGDFTIPISYTLSYE